MTRSSFRSSIILFVLGVAAIAYAQRGPANPQMRGDGPAPEARAFSITRSDPALDEILAPNAEVVELAGGFGLTEGGLYR